MYRVCTDCSDGDVEKRDRLDKDITMAFGRNAIVISARPKKGRSVM